MKRVCFFTVLFGAFLLISGCDLFLNQPDKDAISGAEYEVWLAKAPHLTVRMELVPGSGTPNPPVGLISLPENRPKMEVPFTASFTENPGFGFVEWRAYRSNAPVKDEAAKLVDEVEFKSLNAAGNEVEIRILINEEVTLIPFSVPLPVAAAKNFSDNSSSRLPTNFSPELRFNVPVDIGDPAKALGPEQDPEAVINVIGIKNKGNGAIVDLWDAFDLVIDEGRRWIRLDPRNSGFAAANCNLTITVNTKLRHQDYPLYMAQVVELNYGVTNSPDMTPPVVDSIRGARGTEAEDVFFAGDIQGDPDPYRLTLDEEGSGVVYLFFNADKPLGSIREIRITEELISGINGEPLANQTVKTHVYPSADELQDSETPLARKYIEEFGTMPFVIRHPVQTAEQGIVRFYIHPTDSYGNGYTWEQARNQGLYVDALLDLLPSPISGLAGGYNRIAKTITVNWTDSADKDLQYVSVEWGSEPVQVPKGTQQYTLSNIEPGGSYTLTLYGVDAHSQTSAVAQITVEADASIPSPVANLTADYTGGNIVLSWTNPPGDPDVTDIRISWTGSGTGSREAVLTGSTQTYRIPIAQADGAVYTVSVRTANSLRESGALSAVVYADTTAPGPVTGLSGVFHSGDGTIEAQWTDPAAADLKEIHLEWYTVSAPDTMLGRVVVPNGQKSYRISAGLVIGQEHTIHATAVDNAGNKSAAATVVVATDLTPPGAVTGLKADYSQANGNIKVQWTDPADADLKELHITITRSGQTTEVTVAKGTNTYVIQPVAHNSGIYTISLSTVDAAGNWGESETITARTDNKPGVPTGLTAVNNNDDTGSLSVKWDGVGNATGYEVVRSESADNASAVSTGVRVSGNTAVISGLVNGRVYYVWVRAKNGSSAGDWSAVVSAVPRSNNTTLSSLGIDGAVGGFVFDPAVKTYTAVLLPETGSVQVRAEAAENGTALYQFDDGKYSQTNSKLISAGSVVTLRVKAVAENGTENSDDVYTVTVTRKLAVPAGLTVNPVANQSGKLAVFWSHVTGAGVKYTLAYSKTAGGSPPGDALTVSDITGAAGTIEGLEPGAAYHVWVKAGNSITAAEGDYSPGVTGTLGWDIAELESLLVNSTGLTIPGGTSPVVLAGVTIPYASNTIIMSAVSKNSGSVRYQFGSGPLSSATYGDIAVGATVSVKIEVKSQDGSVTRTYTIPVTRSLQQGIVIGGASDPISISGPTGANLSWGANAPAVFAVSGDISGAAIQWSVDGKALSVAAHGGSYGTQAAVTIYARDYIVSDHTLTVSVTKTGGKRYTQELRFTVTQ